jgi:hypothetical protein
MKRLGWVGGVAAVLGMVLTGCGGSQSPTAMSAAASKMAVTGNWSFAAGAGAPAPFVVNAGFAAPASDPQTGAQQFSGVARITGAGCVSSGTNVVLSGSADAHNNLTLTSQPFGGTTLTLRGQLSADGKSITGATYAFAGGSCAALASGQAAATSYASISGTYAGPFIDAEGNSIAVTANLTQTTQPDPNGQFHLSGSATFANNSCFVSPVVTDSVVTGSSLSTTYSSTQNGQTSTITATGTFNSGSTVLTVSNWKVAGGMCDGETGTGTLTEQP